MYRQKFSSTDDADGFNPIAQTNGLKGGQSYEAHARIKNLERIADANESINEDNAGGGTWVQDVGQVISIEEKLRASRRARFMRTRRMTATSHRGPQRPFEHLFLELVC